jgi:hypothetical protein
MPDRVLGTPGYKCPKKVGWDGDDDGVGGGDGGGVMVVRVVDGSR